MLSDSPIAAYMSHMESSSIPNDHMDAEPGADQGPLAGSPLGVVAPTGSHPAPSPKPKTCLVIGSKK